MSVIRNLIDRLKQNRKVPGKLYPEYNWRVSIEGNTLFSTDWDGKERSINLHEIRRFYVRTTDTGPRCDVWWGMETDQESIELPQGCNGEEAVLDFANSLEGFEMKGMNSADNAVFECWVKGH